MNNRVTEYIGFPKQVEEEWAIEWRYADGRSNGWRFHHALPPGRGYCRTDAESVCGNLARESPHLRYRCFERKEGESR